jgi:hypothetical protein
METTLFITVDTEEDAWGRYDPHLNPTENLRQLPRLQAIFDRYGAMPTYLIDYPVARDEQGMRALLNAREVGRCEIGAHCHPWNTPPFEEERFRGSTMLCNLPRELQYRKLEALHAAIHRAAAVEPVSFRAGRWGFSLDTAQCLHRLGYNVDTSRTPFVAWTQSCGPDHSACPTEPHFLCLDRGCGGTVPEALLEIPVTIGYLQNNWPLCRLLRKNLSHPIGRRLRLLGLLSRLKLLNFAWLSPELSALRVMIRLAQTFIAKGHRCLNLTFHSNALLPGKGPFVACRHELERFYYRIDRFLAWAAAAGIRFASLEQADRRLVPADIPAEEPRW